MGRLYAVGCRILRLDGINRWDCGEMERRKTRFGVRDA